tara:strand:+ start:150 stop:317 length:168 start_codon:yes stop_codon:yes gene_type:complete
MPLYEYICNTPECETKSFEILTTFNSEKKQRCPDCKESTNQKKEFYQFTFSGFGD